MEFKEYVLISILLLLGVLNLAFGVDGSVFNAAVSGLNFLMAGYYYRKWTDVTQATG